MNNIEIKILFYKNKINSILKKIKRLNEKISDSKMKIIEFINTIDDKYLQVLLINKMNNYLESLYEYGEDNIEDYYLIKNRYKNLKYTKNLLNENLFLYWDDTLNNEEKINFILRV